jgi:3-phosphoshikimate 1-carboxyvinyltransferase
VASAQVKTCVLFAGLFADGETVVREPMRTRDHTEIALQAFGADVRIRPGLSSIRGPSKLKGLDLTVPGDLSSAAFFIVAALVLPDSELTIQGVGLNPTRSELLDFLVSIGADIRVNDERVEAGEPVGDIVVRSSAVRGGEIAKDLTAALIDEIPVLAVLGALSENGLIVRDASELRIKETDRIAAIAENLRTMGAEVEESPDGLRIAGRQRLRGAEVDSKGDHRIAMAFAVAALAADGDTRIGKADAASVSFPEFYDILADTVRQVGPRPIANAPGPV